MTSRAEVTTKYAKVYARASKKDKGRVLDAVVDVMGWSRDNAWRRLVAASNLPPGAGRVVAKKPRQPRAPKYSYDALKVLQKVWAASGGQCGKYLAVSMGLQLAALERHGELVDGADRYSDQVRRELLAMSAASIDRYLKGAKATDQIRGVSTTKPSPLLRSSIKVRKAGDEVEAEPGFFEGDTVAHCGPTLKGEFARTLNLTDVHTGWVFTRSIRNNAHTHILSSLHAAIDEIPYAVTGLDFDNGSEFMNWAVIAWCDNRDIPVTRGRPYHHNDNAHVEQRNGDWVRKHAFRYRYETEAEMQFLNELWGLVMARKNHLLPCVKATGWATTPSGRRKRIYDQPRPPYARLIAADVLDEKARTRLADIHAFLNPARLTRRINHIQQQLIELASARTLGTRPGV